MECSQARIPGTESDMIGKKKLNQNSTYTTQPSNDKWTGFWISCYLSNRTEREYLELFLHYHPLHHLIFQWLGNESIHQALEGRLLLIHLLCKYSARRIQAPCISLRIAGSPTATPVKGKMITVFGHQHPSSRIQVYQQQLDASWKCKSKVVETHGSQQLSRSLLQREMDVNKTW